MLPDLRFAVSAVLGSMLLIVTAFGLAATVRVAHQQAAGPGETLRMLAYADPVDWGRFFVEQRPIASVRADAPAVDGAVPERAPVVMPDAAAAAIMPDRPIASVVPDANRAQTIVPKDSAAPAAVPSANAVSAITAQAPAAPVVTPHPNVAATVPDTVAATVSDASNAAVVALDAHATAVAAPDVNATGTTDMSNETGEQESIEVVKPVDEAKTVDPVEQAAVPDSLANSMDLTTSSVRITEPSPSDAKSPSDGFELALEPSERVIGLPAFPNAGPGFVPPRDIGLPDADPESKPAAKPKKKVARRRVRPRPAVEPPLATTGYAVPGFDRNRFAD